MSINGQATAAHSRAAIVGYVLQDDLLHGSCFLRCPDVHSRRGLVPLTSILDKC